MRAMPESLCSLATLFSIKQARAGAGLLAVYNDGPDILPHC